MYRFLSTGKKILTPDKIPKYIFSDARNPEKNLKIKVSINNYMKTITQIEMHESHSVQPFIPHKIK
tara:strand:- start:10255 stop:10452 length:198 start_codon:yes stop_codon:yes gene_type:complete